MRIWLFLTALSLICNAKAENYVSGVSTEAISMPSFSGSVEGVRIESVETQNLGSFAFGMKIEVPKGVNGHQPDLRLSYNSLNGQGVFGQGWELSLPIISVDLRKGVPDFSRNIAYQGPEGELIKISKEAQNGNFYAPLINNLQSLFEFNVLEGKWIWYKSSGERVYYSGVSESIVGQNDKILKWYPTKIIDVADNEITYHYTKEGEHPLLTSIHYAYKTEIPHYAVEFIYEDRDDWITSYKSTYPVTLKKICSEIRVIALSDHLIRSYEIEYTEAPYTKSKFISLIRQKGENGQNPLSPMPPMSFQYSGINLNQEFESVPISFSDSEIFPSSLNKTRTTIVDLNRDSFPDILETSRSGAKVWINGGQGSFLPHYVQKDFISLLGIGQSKLLDVDGDRITDFVTTGLNPVFYKGGIVNQDDEILFSSVPTPIVNMPRYSIGAGNVRTMDINGDGRLDIIAREINNFKTFLSTESGNWGKVSDFAVNTSAYDFSSQYSYVADMNADGLTDLVFVRSEALIFLPNMGNGQFDQPQVMQFEGGGEQIIELFMKNKFNFILDINNDGYSDLISVWKDGFYLSINRGNNYFGPVLSKTGIHGSEYSEVGLHIATLDFNGNGTTDLLWTNDDHDWRYMDFSDGILNLLKEIDNGLGIKTVLEYEFATRYQHDAESLDVDLPYPVLTLKSKKEFHGIVNISEENYSYSGGFYHGIENDFLGFNIVKKSIVGDSSVGTLLTTSKFEQGRLLSNYRQKSMLLSKKEFEGSIFLRGEDYTLTTLDTFPGLDDKAPGISYASQIILKEGDTELNERLAKITRLLDISEDGFIHKDSTSKYLDLNTLVRTEEKVLASPINSNLFILNRVCESNIYDSSNTKISSDRFYYDSEELCKASMGLLTSKKTWNGSSYEHKSSYTYKAFGALASFSDSFNRFSTIEYDSFEINPISVTNPLGHVKSATYNPQNGVMTSMIDENSRTTSFYYDPYLRVVKMVGPADSISLPTVEAVYTFGNSQGTLSSILTKKREKSGMSETFDSKEFFDGKGRNVYKITEGPLDRYVLEGKTYNKRNGEHKVYQKSFVSSFLQPSSMNGIRYFETQFDALARPILIFNPEHSIGKPSYRENYYLVGETIQYDEERKVSYTQNDMLGRRIRVTDALGNEVTYQFNSLDLLTKIIDPQGSETLFMYDSQKRRTCKVDPTVGLTAYSYNTEDLLIQKNMYGFVSGHNSCTPPMGVTPRTVNMEYNDYLNRITKVDFPSVSNTEDLIYSYDELTSAYSKGKLTSVHFGVGSKKFDFDIYGNQSKVTLGIGSSFYVTEKVFNALGKIEKIIYPTLGSNALTINYEFDEATNLKTIKDNSNSYAFASDMKYSPLGQLESVLFGNTTKTTMTYDAAEQSYHLNEILVEKLGLPNTVLQQVGYEYDKIHNITQRLDQKNTFTETYFYDDLHRLTEANLGGSSKTWGFDEIGNITTNNGIAYSYNPTRKQIVTSVGSNTYSFDTFGNITSDPDRAYVFDWSNRLRSMTKASQITTYDYGEDGVRIIKTTPSQTTIFIDKLTELRGSDVVRHIYANNKLIASIDELNNTTYNHSDHLNSSSLKTDASGDVVKRIEYFPFGSKRIEVGSYNNIKQKFTGQYEDEESSLYYYQQRYYDPALARFISADQLYLEKMDERGINSQEIGVYVYARNNPINLVDPDGNAALFGAVFGATVDLGVQLAVSKDRSATLTDWKTWASVGVSAAAGFTGGGMAAVIDKNVARIAINSVGKVATSAALNGAVNAVVSGAQTATMNKINGTNNSISDSVLKGAGIGAAGSLVESAAKAGFNYLSNQTWSSLPVGDKLNSTLLQSQNEITARGTTAIEVIGNTATSMPDLMNAVMPTSADANQIVVPQLQGDE